MSLGTVVGMVVGGVIGFFIGGPYGAAIGAAVGGAAGYLIDPMQVPQPGKPSTQQFELITTKEGLVIPDILGTTKCSGNLMHYYGSRHKEITQKVDSGGKGGGKGGDSEQVVGYKYYLSWQMGICLGPVDAIFAIYKDQDVIWSGLRARTTQHVESIPVPDHGTMDFYFGTQGQPAANLDDSLPDNTLNIPYRNLCYAHFKDFYIGEFNRLPTFYFVVNKSPSFAFNASHQIKTIEYNPVHAIYYILVDRVGMSAAWIDTASFSAAATTLATEEFGIGINMSQSFDSLGWVQNILKTIDGMLLYDTDGKLHLKLVRAGIQGELPTIDDTMMTDPLEFKRDSWSDTKNAIRIIYPYRNNCEAAEGSFREAPYDEPSAPPAPILLINGSTNPTINFTTGTFRFTLASPNMYPGGTYFAGEDAFTDTFKTYNVVIKMSVGGKRFALKCPTPSTSMTEAGICSADKKLTARVTRWDWDSGVRADSPEALFGYEYEEHGDSGPMVVDYNGKRAEAWVEVTDQFYGVLKSSHTIVNIDYTGGQLDQDWFGGP